MPRIGHVDALPPIRLDRKVDDVARLRQDAGGVQHVGERRPGPLGDVRPALFAGDLRDLAAHRKTLHVVHRQR